MSASNRLQIIVVPKDVILHLLAWRPGRPLRMPHSSDIPAGAEVLDVGYDFASHAFLLKVTHDSFPEVPEGEYIPHVPRLPGWSFVGVETKGPGDAPPDRIIKRGVPDLVFSGRESADAAEKLRQALGPEGETTARQAGIVPHLAEATDAPKIADEPSQVNFREFT